MVKTRARNARKALTSDISNRQIMGEATLEAFYRGKRCRNRRESTAALNLLSSQVAMPIFIPPNETARQEALTRYGDS